MTDADPDSINDLIREMCKLHYSRARVLLKRMGLYRGQPPMLRALQAQEGLSHSELAARLRLKPSTVTRMIQRMERAGFVERRQDSEDERIRRVYLTRSGRATGELLEQVDHQLEEEALSGLSSEEGVLLGHILPRIYDNLRTVSEDESQPEGR
jgi:DNA-binding MarR family transcriptional regulator